MINNNSLPAILLRHQSEFAPIVPIDFQTEPFLVCDFSRNNTELHETDLSTIENMEAYVSGKLHKAGVQVGVGGYNEERTVYERSEQFQTNDEVRSIHLGIDIWMKAGTPVYAPLDGKIHSFQNNGASGDFGPTLILEHQLEDTTFYTLYGHLSLESLNNKYEGQTIARGEPIATLGSSEVNGHWPPHLHFQVITDLLGQKGDFIGVAPKSERDYYLSICPDPNLILGIPSLKPPRS